MGDTRDAGTGAGFDSVIRVVRRVQRRLRTQRALDAGCLGAVLALALGTLLLAAHKTGAATLDARAIIACVALPAIFALVAGLRRVAPLRAAHLADESHGLSDLLSSAWAFRDQGQPTPFMHACIARAAARAPTVHPDRAVALRPPRATPGLALAGIVLAVVAALEVPVQEAVAATPPPRIRLIAEDDVEAFRAGVRELELDARHDADLARRADELNSLLEGLADGDLDQAEALRALEELRAALEEGRDEDAQALREALAELGEGLKGAALAQETAEALADGDARRAAESLDALAGELPETPKSQQRDLAKRLQRAAKPSANNAEARLERAQRELGRLLKKKAPEQPAARQSRERLLKKKKRELDRLRREHAEQQRMRRELEQLRRDLGGAGEQLGQGARDAASKGMSDAARELSRMAQRQQSAEQRESLQRQLAQLREMIRRGGGQQRGGEGQSGETRRLSVARFGKRARGGQDGRQGGEQGGQRGDQGREGEQGVLVPSDGAQGGDTLMMPGVEPGAQASALGASTADGSGAGEGGRPEEGEGTRLDSRKVDVRVTGVQGEGPSRAEVIRDASSRGFASRSYRKVHTDYQRHAEEVLERDHVPGGYRFYVRRYFQLIRPRDATP